MIRSTLYLVAFFLLTSAIRVNAQAGVCGNFHRKYCVMDGTRKDKREFNYNAQSKSGLFSQGSTSKMRCVIYKGMDYRMTVCCDAALGEQISFKIMDAKTNEELYDNAKAEGEKQFEFQSAATRQLIIEVTVPTGESKAEKGKPVDAACVGLLIEHKVSDKTGFSTY
jgi:hypothetical protein